MDIVLQSHPDVVAHNIETVRRLTPSVRSVATYEGSLHVLKHIHDSGFVTKSGLMLGLGETEEEVLETLRDLRDCGVERVTIGQYLQPTARHLPVEAYITPEKFRSYHEQAVVPSSARPIRPASGKAIGCTVTTGKHNIAVRLQRIQNFPDKSVSWRGCNIEKENTDF